LQAESQVFLKNLTTEQ